MRNISGRIIDRFSKAIAVISRLVFMRLGLFMMLVLLCYLGGWSNAIIESDCKGVIELCSADRS